MTLANAKAAAQADASKNEVPLVIVREGPHADDFAERDTDGESYGYCPADAVPILYKYGTVVEEVRP